MWRCACSTGLTEWPTLFPPWYGASLEVGGVIQCRQWHHLSGGCPDKHLLLSFSSRAWLCQVPKTHPHPESVVPLNFLSLSLLFLPLLLLLLSLLLLPLQCTGPWPAAARQCLPPAYIQLAEACWARQSTSRPSADIVLQRLLDMLADVEGQMGQHP